MNELQQIISVYFLTVIYIYMYLEGSVIVDAGLSFCFSSCRRGKLEIKYRKCTKVTCFVIK